MLADERKPPEDIAAITYSRINHVLRDEIAGQMAEFEKRNKVTPVHLRASFGFYSDGLENGETK